MEDETQAFITGTIFGIFLGIIGILLLNGGIPKDHTLIKNENNDWYWLQSKTYTENQLMNIIH